MPSATFLKTTIHHSISDWHNIVLQWEYSPSHLFAVLSFMASFFFFFRVPKFLELILIHQGLLHAIWALKAKSLIWKTLHQHRSKHPQDLLGALLYEEWEVNIFKLHSFLSDCLRPSVYLHFFKHILINHNKRNFSSFGCDLFMCVLFLITFKNIGRYYL